MPESGHGAPDDELMVEDDMSTPPTHPLATDDLDVVLARRASPRRRLVQLGAIIVPILVAASLVLRGTLPAATPSSTYVAVPTWTPLPIPITVTSNVSFGTLTLNGKPLAGPPPRDITLRPGNNIITLAAPPFSTQSCVVHGPLIMSGSQAIFRSDSTCQITTEGDAGGYPTHVYVMLMISGDTLPPDLRASAQALVARTLDIASPQTATVPVGDYYATGMSGKGVPNARRATVPLTATLTQTFMDSAAIASATASYPFPIECSSALCAGGYDPSQPLPSHAWLVDVQTVFRWYFTTPSGLLAGSLVLPAPIPRMVMLIYNPDDGWQVAEPWPSPYDLSPGQPVLCQAGMDVLGQASSSQGGVNGDFGMRQPETTVDDMRGCALQIMSSNDTVLGTFIWRFGVLLAKDKDAHALLPSVPIAPSQEIAAVGA
jgi:hypothetical protein